MVIKGTYKNFNLCFKNWLEKGLPIVFVSETNKDMKAILCTNRRKIKKTKAKVSQNVIQ